MDSQRWTAPTRRQEKRDIGRAKLPQKDGIHIDASLSRQPSVKKRKVDASMK